MGTALITSMPPATRERSDARAPLATFVVLAFNQDAYVGKAICAAFAQTYRPLQILLSDDGSTDRTFQIMREMADAYTGTADIVVNRNEHNLNIGGHISRIADLVVGEIVVMSAGDDISCPQRTTELLATFLADPRCHAVFSDYSVIDDDGTELEKHHRCWDSGGRVDLCSLAYGGGGVGAGATYAYRREVFYWPAKYPDGANREDRLLPWRSFFLGGVTYLPIPLVEYRQSVAGISRDLSAANVPASQRPEHIERLQYVLNSAEDAGLIGRRSARLCRRALDSLVAHMGWRNRIAAKSGRFAGMVVSVSRLIFARFFLPDRLLGKRHE